ncbi:hypothetical protein [Streptomyces laurentii]|uniref:hypothetical protein n=1 Tax=Streptomyces laurentii TaxID=39478 RepID=UPI0036C44EC7
MTVVRPRPPARRRAAAALLAAGALALPLTACTAPTAPAAPAAPAAPQVGTPVTPVEVCANLVAYWVREALTDGPQAGLDWEQKGMSNEQLVLHDEILAAARTEERRAGREAAAALAARESRRRCAAAHGATGSSENWRPPGEQRTPTDRSRPSPTRAW